MNTCVRHASLLCRRFFRSSLQPIAEHLEYNPVAVAARYRGNYLGSVSLPTQQQASSFAASSDGPKREGSTPDALPGQALDPDRIPPEDAQDRPGRGVAKVGTRATAPAVIVTLGSLF